MHKIANHAQTATLNILVSKLWIHRKPIPALLSGWTPHGQVLLRPLRKEVMSSEEEPQDADSEAGLIRAPPNTSSHEFTGRPFPCIPRDLLLLVCQHLLSVIKARGAAAFTANPSLAFSSHYSPSPFILITVLISAIILV